MAKLIRSNHVRLNDANAAIVQKFNKMPGADCFTENITHRTGPALRPSHESSLATKFEEFSNGEPISSYVHLDIDADYNLL